LEEEVDVGGSSSWEHRDLASIRAIDSDGGVIVLGRVHVLGVQTLSEQAVLLKLLSDKQVCMRIR